MIKKLLYVLISLAVIVTGVYSFKKLDFYERSLRIFKAGNQTRFFEGRGDRGSDRFRIPPDSIMSAGRFNRGGGRNIPDSLARRSGRPLPPEGFRNNGRGNEFRGMQRPGGEMRQGRQQPGNEESGFVPRGNRNDGRRGYFGGQKVRLANIWLFLSVFALFTVITLWTDRFVCLINRRRRTDASCN